MSFGVKFNATYEGNLPQAERILNRRGTATLNDLGRTLKTEAQSRVRRFIGEEARTIRVQVSGSRLNKFVEVFGELVQHYVDEYGLPPGIFPPWDVGTRVFNWVDKKGLTRLVSTPQKTRRVSHVATRRPKAAGNRSAGAQTGRGHQESSGRTARQARAEVSRTRRAGTTTGRSIRSLARERQVRRVSFLVARGIFERGIRANAWASRTLEDNRVRIIRDLQQAFTDAIIEINS